MAHLIRFPEDSLNAIRDRLCQPELSERELFQLELMENDPLVRKFGQKMRYCRQRDALIVMPLSKSLVPAALLDELFHDRFEKSSTSTDFVMLGVNFLEFLLSDETCRAALARCASFIPDLLRYEHAKAWTVRQPLLVPDPSLPVGSRLLHRAFITTTLEHDVPPLDRLRSQGKPLPDAPARRDMTLLFVRTSAAPFYRMFQIDEALRRFLAVQREDPASCTEELPSCYSNLVKLGLCRNLG